MNLAQFKEYIRGKDIIVVGNSLNSLEEKNGALIDDYDRVIRFGKGIPNAITSEYVGSFTHGWVAGQMRLPMISLIPKGCQVFFNPSLKDETKSSLDRITFELLEQYDDYIQLYNPLILKKLKDRYNIHEDRRLSAGAIAAHFLTYRCRTYKSITFINFDCFKNSTLFYSSNQGKTSIASSYHLPLLVDSHIPEDFNDIPHGHPAHDCNGEVRMFQDLLKHKRVHWIGELPSEDTPNRILADAPVQYLSGRRALK